MSGKEALHRLVDDLPEDRWEEARLLLEDLGRNGAEEILTPGELAEIEEGRRAIDRGEHITLEELKRKHGL